MIELKCCLRLSESLILGVIVTVITPLGVGVINALDNIYTWIVFKQYAQELPFKYEHLKPYTSPHDRLIELGFELTVDVDWANMDFSHKFSKDEQRIIIYLHDKTVTVYEVGKEAIAIIPEYLEYLEEMK